MAETDDVTQATKDAMSSAEIERVFETLRLVGGEAFGGAGNPKPGPLIEFPVSADTLTPNPPS